LRALRLDLNYRERTRSLVREPALALAGKLEVAQLSGDGEFERERQPGYLFDAALP